MSDVKEKAVKILQTLNPQREGVRIKRHGNQQKAGPARAKRAPAASFAQEAWLCTKEQGDEEV
jgi:hypothetical protein